MVLPVGGVAHDQQLMGMRQMCKQCPAVNCLTQIQSYPEQIEQVGSPSKMLSCILMGISHLRSAANNTFIAQPFHKNVIFKPGRSEGIMLPLAVTCVVQ